jgi:hypothetical protein
VLLKTRAGSPPRDIVEEIFVEVASLVMKAIEVKTAITNNLDHPRGTL